MLTKKIMLLYMAKYGLLKDPNFKRGFNIRGLGGAPERCGVEMEATFGQSEKPCWNYSQWAAKYNLANPNEGTITEYRQGVFEMKTPTNCLLVDTNQKCLDFTCITTNCYTHHRTSLSDPWQHLLIETNFTDVQNPAPYCMVKNLRSLTISGKVKLLNFEDHMGEAFDENIHAAQFLLYLTIHNANKNSKGFGEMIWFGVNFFDNRHEWSEYSAMFDVGTQCLMVGIGNRPVFPGGNSFFDDGRIVFGEESPEYSFEIEAASKIRKAYFTAREEGYFQNTEFEDLCVSGMNMGWEMPGTYNVSMRVRDFDITAEA